MGKGHKASVLCMILNPKQGQGQLESSQNMGDTEHLSLETVILLLALN